MKTSPVHLLIPIFILILAGCGGNITVTADQVVMENEDLLVDESLESTGSESGTTLSELSDVPDLIFHNGHLVTMDSSQPDAEAMAIQNDLIMAVGSNSDILNLAGEKTQVIDLDGRTLMPGFIDSHSHKITQKENWGFTTFAEANQEAISHGWTGLDELLVDPNAIHEIIQADQRGEIDLRLNLYLAHNAFAGDDFGDWYQAYDPGQQVSPHVRIAGIKIFIDFNSGREFFFSPDTLSQLLKQLQDDGWQVAMKAVSIQSHELALAAIDSALAGESNDLYRYRLEHSTAATDQQVSYMAENGIIPCILPTLPGVYAFEPDIHQIAKENGYENTYRWSDYYDAGVFMVASPLNPHGQYEELYTASHISPVGMLYRSVTQIGPEYPEPESWMLAHTLTVEQLLPMLTINGAYTTFEEDYKGSLEAGKWADLVVFSENPLQVDTDRLLEIDTILTMIGGSVVYCKAGFEAFCDFDQADLEESSDTDDQVFRKDQILIPAGGAVQIAVQGPASGQASGWFPAIEQTVHLAVDDHGPVKNDFPIELIVFDDQCNQDTAASAAAVLMDEYPDLIAVVGPLCSSGGLGALPFFQGKRLPVISGSATKDELSDRYGADVFNRTIYSDSQLSSQGLTEDYLNDTAAVQDFINRYESFYGPAPADVLTYLPYTYDAAMLLLEAIEQSAILDDNGGLTINRASLISEIRRITIQGTTGDVAIDGAGNRDTYPGGN